MDKFFEPIKVTVSFAGTSGTSPDSSFWLTFDEHIEHLTKRISGNDNALGLLLAKSHVDNYNNTPNELSVSGVKYLLIGSKDIEDKTYLMWACLRYGSLRFVYTLGSSPKDGDPVYDYDGTVLYTTGTTFTSAYYALKSDITPVSEALSALTNDGKGGKLGLKELLAAIGAGGGGVTPEQYNALAKELTLQDAAAVLARHLHPLRNENEISCIFVNDVWYFNTGRLIDAGGKAWLVWKAYGTHGSTTMYSHGEVAVGTQVYYAPDMEESDYEVVQKVEADTIAKEQTLRRIKDDAAKAILHAVSKTYNTPDSIPDKIIVLSEGNDEIWFYAGKDDQHEGYIKLESELYDWNCYLRESNDLVVGAKVYGFYSSGREYDYGEIAKFEYTKLATSEELQTLSNKVGVAGGDATKIFLNMIQGVPFVYAGEVKNGSLTYYKWHGALTSEIEVDVYTGARTPENGALVLVNYGSGYEVADGILVDYAMSVTIGDMVTDTAKKVREIQAAIAAIKVGMVIVQQTETSGLMLESGTTSVWASPIASLSFGLLAPSNGTEAHYRLRFVAASGFTLDAPTLVGDLPSWAEGKTYEMDIVSDGTTNYALVKEW